MTLDILYIKYKARYVVVSDSDRAAWRAQPECHSFKIKYKTLVIQEVHVGDNIFPEGKNVGKGLDPSETTSVAREECSRVWPQSS